MLCPNCKKEMLVLEFELVEIDHCGQCGGVWLDSGELKLIGRHIGALHADLLSALESQRGEPQESRPKRRCPLCRKPFLRVRAAGKGDIQVEKCPHNDGLWFEAGAFQAVIKSCAVRGALLAAGADSANVFARFLADLDAQRSGAAPHVNASSPVHRESHKQGGD